MHLLVCTWQTPPGSTADRDASRLTRRCWHTRELSGRLLCLRLLPSTLVANFRQVQLTFVCALGRLSLTSLPFLDSDFVWKYASPLQDLLSPIKCQKAVHHAARYANLLMTHQCWIQTTESSLIQDIEERKRRLSRD